MPTEHDEILQYIKRAFELKNQECYKQAIEMLYKAIAIEPDNIEILFQIGELYYLLHNYTRAVQYPEQILSVDENHIPALKLIKNIYLKQDMFYQAKDIAEKLYNLEPIEENMVSLVKIYGQLDMFDEIIKLYDKIKDSEKALYAYASSKYHAGDFSSASEIIERALEKFPNSEDFLILKGKILFDSGDFSGANEIFSKFDKNSLNPEILNYHGLFAMENNDFLTAIKMFSKAFNADTKNSKYVYNLANAYFLNGWHQEASEAYKKAIQLEPDNLDFRYSYAYLCCEDKEYAKAKNDIEYILNYEPTHAGGNVLKAIILKENKNFIEAESLLLKNISNGFDDEFTLSTLAEIECDLGKYDKAENHISTVVGRDINNLSYKSILAEIFIKQKKYIEAIDLANIIISINENYVDGYIIGAKASFALNKFEETKKFAQNALSIDMNCSEAYYYLALYRKNENDFEEAIECMKRAILYKPDDSKYYAQMAEIYKKIGDTKTAFEYIKEAEDINPSEEYKILYREYAALNRK